MEALCREIKTSSVKKGFVNYGRQAALHLIRQKSKIFDTFPLRGRLLGKSQMLRREERLVGVPGWNIHRNGGTRVGAAFFRIDYGSLDFT